MAFNEAQRTYREWAAVETEIHRTATKLAVLERVEELQREKQIVLSLFYVEGLSREEVATAMGTSVEIIDALRESALQKLQAT